MILLDTTKVPICLTYHKGWDFGSTTSPDPKIPQISGLIRVPEKDLLKIGYKDSEMCFVPCLKSFKINGDTSQAAIGLALVIQSTLHTLDNDILDEAFSFDNDGSIIKFNWQTSMQIEFFIEEYNKVYLTVLLLK